MLDQRSFRTPAVGGIERRGYVVGDLEHARAAARQGVEKARRSIAIDI